MPKDKPLPCIKAPRRPANSSITSLCKARSALAKAIPEGYEIYENPNAQVFLRRIPPQLITEAERQVVAEGMRTYAMVKDYKVDVKGKALLIYTAVQDIDTLAALFKDLYPDPTANVELMANLRKAVHYSPMLVFQLVDATRRTFQTQRYCFLGSVDDSIEIGKPGTLPTLVKRYVKHLGQDLVLSPSGSPSLSATEAHGHRPEAGATGPFLAYNPPTCCSRGLRSHRARLWSIAHRCSILLAVQVLAVSRQYGGRECRPMYGYVSGTRYADAFRAHPTASARVA